MRLFESRRARAQDEDTARPALVGPKAEVCLPADKIALVDEQASWRGRSRADYLRRLIPSGLERSTA
ncbi:hypothetical protein I3F58_09600 [Streptomyces sp. MUM 203J]|uniref:hypothetical protein n=1 Tax=Streptomyces sp. MUM 203J TaxID=2791990 RepID=UPI001F041B85|nr:hypothetical protein [Streptomyces sp. MUM 203J]MCH0539814.1 hypothetical protein [Streptomyces sp. MUM 203J]